MNIIEPGRESMLGGDRTMKSGLIRLSLFGLICITILSHCGSPVQYPGDLSVDVTTMATPKGGKLKPAEEGPVRSTLGQPKIDLDNFELSVSGLVDSPFSLTWPFPFISSTLRCPCPG